MAAILQATFSSAFYGIKTFEFQIKFHWNRPEGLIDSIGADNGLVPNRRLAIIWNNDGMFYWCIYASLCFSELKL